MELDGRDRIFVSYIDKSREYYLAQGFGNPYRWAHHSDAPFLPLRKPLAESRMALVTTAMPMEGRESRAPLGRLPKKTAYAAASDPAPGALFTQDLAWDKEATHTNDVESFLPLKRLTEAAQSQRIGAAGPRFYGVPTEYSQRNTIENDAPAILGWCREDNIDAALLIGL